MNEMFSSHFHSLFVTVACLSHLEAINRHFHTLGHSTNSFVIGHRISDFVVLLGRRVRLFRHLFYDVVHKIPPLPPVKSRQTSPRRISEMSRNYMTTKESEIKLNCISTRLACFYRRSKWITSLMIASDNGNVMECSSNEARYFISGGKSSTLSSSRSADRLRDSFFLTFRIPNRDNIVSCRCSSLSVSLFLIDCGSDKTCCPKSPNIREIFS